MRFLNFGLGFGTCIPNNIDLSIVWAQKYFQKHDLSFQICYRKSKLLVDLILLGSSSEDETIIFRTNHLPLSRWQDYTFIQSKEGYQLLNKVLYVYARLRNSLAYIL